MSETIKYILVRDNHLLPSSGGQDPSSIDNKEVDSTQTSEALAAKSKSVSTVGSRSRGRSKGGPVTTKNWSVLSGVTPFPFPRKLDNKPYTVMQQFEQLTLTTTSNAVATFAVVQFAVSDLDQISSLTALFDQYRIVEVEVWITPNVGTSIPTGAWASVIDYDDATALATYNAALDYQNCMQTSLAQAHYRKFKPHAAMAAYSGVFTSFANVESPWIDAASTGVLHYGMKTAATVTGVAITMNIVKRYTVQWRNLR